ncbi:MAG: hypothetical protein H5T62_18565, partial [Anaerolineae bacterium]|nr:hypothetical protein [Anaerolineae bacterium]
MSRGNWPVAPATCTYHYAPFGSLLAGGVSDNTRRFTGETQDPTGLLYLRARYYDPTTGRFLTRDPFPGLAALPSTQHPYVYVGNNPVNLTDPSGEFAFIPLLLVAAAGGFLGGVSYYTLEAYLQADPCTGMQWKWQEALFWGGVGTGIGAVIGTGIYGGWWVGVQLGWWGTTGTVTTGSYTVYWYMENGVPRYIGQTIDFVRRAGEHLLYRGWKVSPIPGLENLSQYDARAVEQVLIEY